MPCNTNYGQQTYCDINPLQDIGTIFQPQLVGSKNSFSGNKNKNWVFGSGFHRVASEDPGDDMNVMDTAFLQQFVDQNCSRNSTDLAGQFQVDTCDIIHENAMQNGFFGFIPKGPLKVYDGSPVSWNYIPDIIRAQW